MLPGYECWSSQRLTEIRVIKSVCVCVSGGTVSAVTVASSSCMTTNVHLGEGLVRQHLPERSQGANTTQWH